ncbi:hypothetical protein CRG98_015083 [Punica granatum]|uniref:DUF7745 domain-containing protein n=1 Tax=Punica granatum TaxID=22663 RepID=A0A2I0K8K3_PUNGR|nr:hypothetical protein CRG98_015083 [Punica granatum]
MRIWRTFRPADRAFIQDIIGDIIMLTETPVDWIFLRTAAEFWDPEHAGQLSTLLHISVQDIHEELHQRWDEGIWIAWFSDWTLLRAMTPTTASYQRDACHEFLLLVFGTLLFPYSPSLTDRAIAQVVLQAVGGHSYVEALLAETVRSLDYVREVRRGRMRGSPHLLQIWLLAHICPFCSSHPFSYIADERSLIERLVPVIPPLEHSFSEWRRFWRELTLARFLWIARWNLDGPMITGCPGIVGVPLLSHLGSTLIFPGRVITTGVTSLPDSSTSQDGIRRSRRCFRRGQSSSPDSFSTSPNACSTASDSCGHAPGTLGRPSHTPPTPGTFGSTSCSGLTDILRLRLSSPHHGTRRHGQSNGRQHGGVVGPTQGTKPRILELHASAGARTNGRPDPLGPTDSGTGRRGGQVLPVPPPVSIPVPAMAYTAPPQVVFRASSAPAPTHPQATELPPYSSLQPPVGFSYQVPPPINTTFHEPGTPTHAAQFASSTHFLPEVDAEQERRLKRMEETIRALQASDARPDARYGDCSLFLGMHLPPKLKAGKKLDLGIKLGRMEGPADQREEPSKKAPTMSPSSGGRRGKEVSVNAVNTAHQASQQYSVNLTTTPTTAPTYFPPPPQHHPQPIYYSAPPVPPPTASQSYDHFPPTPAQPSQSRPPVSRAPPPAQQNPTSQGQQAGGAQSRPCKQYTPLPASLSHIYRQLLARNQIQPISPGQNFDPSVQDQSKRCEYHQGAPGHTLDNCWRLRDEIQRRIDSNRLIFNAVRPPNVQANPLPDHKPSSGP